MSDFKGQKHESFSRRTFIVMGILGTGFATIYVRLFNLQLIRHAYFKTESDDNQLREQIISPSRGVIFDRYGRPVAINTQNYRVLLQPSKVKNLDYTLKSLQEYFHLTSDKILVIKRKIKQLPKYSSIIVTENISWEQFSYINYKTVKLPGVLSDVGETRFYPQKELLGHITGYVGAVTEADLNKVKDKKRKLLLRQPGFLIGRQGLEYSLDKSLRGKAGLELVQVNAFGRVVKAYDDRKIATQKGKAVFITIDIDLQKFITKRLQGLSASCVVLDVLNGDILATVSVPSYDPNHFAKGISTKQWQELRQNKFSPLLNKSLAGQYPPGSTYKMITALAALKDGHDPKQKIRCQGKIYYGNRWFNCWKRKGHGKLDLQNAIAQSCDIYFWELAKKLDIDKLSAMADKFSFGQKYDISINGLKSGINPSREWKKAYFRKNKSQQRWFGGDTLSSSIGQGYVTATPLQLAVMTARLASGKIVIPRLVRAIGSMRLPQKYFENINVSSENLQIVRTGMDWVVNKSWGTTFSQHKNGSYKFAGKTGTSQVVRVKIDPSTGKTYKNKDLPYRLRDHALFVCYVPLENPRYAISVVVEHGGGGSSVAAPIAKDIISWLENNKLARKKTIPWTEYLKRIKK